MDEFSVRATGLRKNGGSRRPLRILLVRPQMFNSVCASTPPLGIGYLLTSLKRDGVPVDFLDLSVTPNPEKQLNAIFARPDKPQIVGVQVFSNELASASDMLCYLREKLGSQAVLVAGGPHITTMPHLLFDHLPEADFGICGEAEKSLTQLCRYLAGDTDVGLEQIEGLVWRKNGGLRINGQSFVEDLDAIGEPDWDGMHLENYRADAFGGGFNRDSPAMCIQTSRGCPFNCSFCAVVPISGHKFRRHSGRMVAQMVQSLADRGYREIKIVDDNLAADPRHVREIREAFEEKQINISVSFACGMHLRTINEQVIEDGKAIGLYEVMIAIEAGSDRILKDMNKKITVDLAREKIALLRKHNLPVTAYFMLGYPTETLEDMNKTIRLALDLPLERVHFNCFSPYPGSPIFDRLRSEGKLANIDMTAIHAETVNYSFVPGMSVKQLAALRRRALLSFYLRPRILWKFFRGMHNPTIFHFRMGKILEYFGLIRSNKKKRLLCTVDKGRAHRRASQDDDLAVSAFPYRPVGQGH